MVLSMKVSMVIQFFLHISISVCLNKHESFFGDFKVSWKSSLYWAGTFNFKEEGSAQK